MKDRIVQFFATLFSKEFVAKMQSYIMQLSLDTLPKEEKKRLATEFGIAIINELQAGFVRKLPTGIPQWLATVAMQWTDAIEAKFVADFAEMIYQTQQATVRHLAANPRMAAELLGGRVEENKIVMTVDVAEQADLMTADVIEQPETTVTTVTPVIPPADPETKANLVEQIKSHLVKGKDK